MGLVYSVGFRVLFFSYCRKTPLEARELSVKQTERIPVIILSTIPSVAYRRLRGALKKEISGLPKEALSC